MEQFHPKYIASLIDRYLRGRIAPEEQNDLNTWQSDKAGNKTSFQELVEGNLIAANLNKLNGVDSKKAFDEFKHRIGYPTRKTRTLRRWLPYAAAAVLVSCAAGLLIWHNAQQRTDLQIVGADVSPGGNRAILTTQDGRAITLDDSYTGIIVGDGVHYDNGREILPAVSGQLTMATPNGGTYQVTLPDGSMVWLNAASSISYPTKFASDERVVSLAGEAYFSVSKDLDRPFKVLSGGQHVEVLGTEFNVSAYTDEHNIKTTLVKGSVKVAALNSRSAILVPGEQSILLNGEFSTAKVDVTQYTSWKEGWFIFDNKPFAEIMREVERWYDIDVRYDGPVPKEIGYGMIPRSDNLSVVLRLLEAGGIRFRFANRTLTILNQGKEVG